MTRLRWMGAAVLSALFFGTSGTFVKPLLDAGWSPGAGSLIRTAVSALILAVPTWHALRGRWRLVRRHWLGLLLFGAVGIAITQSAYFFAVGRIPVSTALMIEYLAPVLLVTATSTWLRRFPPFRVVGGTVAAVVGLALVLDVGAGIAVDPIGLCAALIATVGCASYFQLSATLPLPPIALTGLGFAIATIVSGLLGAVGLVPIVIGPWSVDLAGSTVSAVVPLAVVALIAGVAGYSVAVAAASRIGARAMSFLALTEVLFATVAAVLVLGQVPGPLQIVGGLALVAGVVLVISVRSDRERPADGPGPNADLPHAAGVGGAALSGGRTGPVRRD